MKTMYVKSDKSTKEVSKENFEDSMVRSEYQFKPLYKGTFSIRKELAQN